MAEVANASVIRVAMKLGKYLCTYGREADAQGAEALLHRRRSMVPWLENHVVVVVYLPWDA